MESDTINPEEAFTNTTGAEGTVTALTATVGQISQSNPYIMITFSSPVNGASVIYDTTVSVEYPPGTPLTESVDYDGTTGTSNLFLDLTSASPASGNTVRIILTAGINAYADNSVNLTPVNVTRTLP
ncbi:MAG: hypothetical protein JW982_08990 [Spirochaetes bacterium]|nr:hypothetical protein [Spirochaetota bacterium]